MTYRDTMAYDVPYAHGSNCKVHKSEPQRLYNERIYKNSDYGPSGSYVRSVYGVVYGITTYGMDPMVSKASVIHELVHERPDNNLSLANSCPGYPVQKEYVSPSIDLRI